MSSDGTTNTDVGVSATGGELPAGDVGPAMSETNGHSAATLPAVAFKLGPLLAHHRRGLHERGLTDSTIESAGLYSEEKPDALGAILNWEHYPKKLPPALMIPYPADAAGRNGYCRARPDNPRCNRRDGKKIKYESPKGQPNRVYTPAGALEAVANPKSELLLTEGEFKALKATQDGFTCIGLAGAFGWKAGRAERLLPALADIKWSDRPTFIVFDSDMIRKPDVQEGEARFAKLLQNLGAKVKVVRLPDGPPDANGEPTKLGLDDFLVAHGAAELRKLLDSASDPEPAEVTKKDAAALDPATAAKGFLETGIKDGVSTLRYQQGSFFRWRRGRYCEVPLSDVRGYLVSHLAGEWGRLSGGITSNVLDHVRSQSLLDFDIAAPAWLCDRDDWQPTEMLSTLTALVHLPSLVERKASYSIPPTPKFFTFSALDYPFAADAPDPVHWKWFLQCLFEDDAEAISLLQQWFGLSLLPETRYQKILFILGPKRSGKGTIFRILTRLVGELNVCNPTLGSLGDRFGLSPLIGKLLAIVSDARLSGRNDQAPIVERLLSISGEDSQTIDRKNLPLWNGKLSTRFVICSNEVPRLHDTSGALASRMLVVQTRKSFLGNEILDLYDQLLKELPSILLWAIDGWRTLKQQGRFSQPASATDVSEELADLGSPVNVFVRERCRVGAECSVPRAVLYNAFKLWAAEQGKQKIEDDGGFGRSLRAAVPGLGKSQPRVDGEKVWHYTGIQLA